MAAAAMAAAAMAVVWAVEKVEAVMVETEAGILAAAGYQEVNAAATRAVEVALGLAGCRGTSCLRLLAGHSRLGRTCPHYRC
jgi:hypothetical protein